MKDLILKNALCKIKDGDDLERERVIRHYQPYIQNVVSHICKRYINWSSDEASIGLIAFNRALDTFDSEKGRTFLNYAFLLIQRDLIDYFRKENQHYQLSAMSSSEEDRREYKDQSKASLEIFKQSKQASSLVEEILELDEILRKFRISFEELENHCPKHSDTRLGLLEMANAFIESQELVDELFKKCLLPIKEFTRKTGYRPKNIERHRKYLITIIVIKLNPEWTHLSTFIAGGTGSVKK
ncbi:RNA polymerase sigma-I factor [Bacillus suaedae]|uniref:RNA polymerase sigma factor SigI n=1 Tax=Halalkalibacter suaedae TaxID=2822140 RepID=A0A941ATY9_9BACI|nr:RNA polymerase sigma-I factor [Bacillus suaedae]MBP3953054.1 RNA polymerase sigma-I factor [Bacillus suaedae]